MRPFFTRNLNTLYLAAYIAVVPCFVAQWSTIMLHIAFDNVKKSLSISFPQNPNIKFVYLPLYSITIMITSYLFLLIKLSVHFKRHSSILKSDMTWIVNCEDNLVTNVKSRLSLLFNWKKCILLLIRSWKFNQWWWWLV